MLVSDELNFTLSHGSLAVLSVLDHNTSIGDCTFNPFKFRTPQLIRIKFSTMDFVGQMPDTGKNDCNWPSSGFIYDAVCFFLFFFQVFVCAQIHVKT